MIVTDYNGNVIEFTGSKQDALDAGHNVDCINCKWCRSCSKCSKCSKCSYCSDCSYCSSCSSCSYCSDCSDCSDCSRCSRCSYCSYCSSQPILNTPTSRWVICLRADHTMKIGCQDHDILKWLAFTDEEIAAMSDYALEFWRTWKPIIEAVVAQFPKKVESSDAN